MTVEYVLWFRDEAMRVRGGIPSEAGGGWSAYKKGLTEMFVFKINSRVIIYGSVVKDSSGLSQHLFV